MTNKSAFLYIAVLAAGLSVTACKHQAADSRQQPANAGAEKMDTLSVTVYRLKDESGWAYTVNIGQKAYIRQEMIPGISGVHRFQTKEDAQKVGVLMVQKLLKDHHSLPAITRDDLVKLNIAGI
jgi:hypothetical protein